MITPETWINWITNDGSRAVHESTSFLRTYHNGCKPIAIFCCFLQLLEGAKFHFIYFPQARGPSSNFHQVLDRSPIIFGGLKFGPDSKKSYANFKFFQSVPILKRFDKEAPSPYKLSISFTKRKLCYILFICS